MCTLTNHRDTILGSPFFVLVKAAHIRIVVCSCRNIGAHTKSLAHETVCPQNHVHILAHPKSLGTWARNHLHIDNRLHVSFAFSKAPKSTHNLSVDRLIFAHTRFFAHALAPVHFVMYTHIRVRPRPWPLCFALGARSEVSYLLGKSWGLEEKTQVLSPCLFFVVDVPFFRTEVGSQTTLPLGKTAGTKASQRVTRFE